MIKRILLVSIMIIGFGISGCTKNTTNEVSTDEEYVEAYDAVDVVVQALENKDAELFKTVLTDRTIQETPHLDEEIQSVFDMLEGKMVEVREHKVSSSEVDLYGKKINAISMYYDLVTSEKEYLLDMMYIPGNDDVFEKNGFFFVVLADYDREYTNFVASCPYAFNIRCGVFSSDIETMEFNEKILGDFFREEGFEPVEGGVKFDLNRVGIEKIIELEVVEVDEEGAVEYSVVDSINNKYHVYADEGGAIYMVRENDANGNVVLEGY